MKFKKWPIHIWFLDDDLQKSAEFLTDAALKTSISGCFGAMMSAYMHFIGIRSKRFYSYYFGKEHIAETMANLFGAWPSKRRPMLSAYSWKESKWCRSCHENFDYVCQYISILLDEFYYRTKSIHDISSSAEWVKTAIGNVMFPYAGIENVSLPWKAIEPRFRRVNVIDGYRLQFMSKFEDNDPFKAYSKCIRDIPDFVLDHFNSRNAFES